MKNVVSAMIVACAVSAAIGVSAQGDPGAPTQPAVGTQQPPTGTRQPVPDTQSPAAPTEQRSAASPRASGNTVTISGCIQNAPPAAGGAAASASPAGPKFVLANAKASAGASGSAVGTAGSAATATRYRLDGDDKAISPHLNHQVEITGTVQTSAASATGAANAAPGSAAAGPMLKVDSVKMVSATCPQQ